MTPEKAKEIAEAAYQEARVEATKQLGITIYSTEAELRFALGYLRRAMQSALEEHGK